MSEVLKEFRTLQTIRISFRRKGFMFIEPDGYLSLIMVRSPQRRKGLGAAMLRYAKRLYPHLYAIPISDESEKLFAEHHIPAIPPWVNADWDKAEALRWSRSSEACTQLGATGLPVGCRCYKGDGGRPSEAAQQGEASNRLNLLWSRQSCSWGRLLLQYPGDHWKSFQSHLP